jgi:miniconductance mechanosensitive channel
MSVIELHPAYTYLGVVLVALLIAPFLQAMVAWSVLRFAIYTESVVDDLFVDTLRPFRFVYVLPVALAFLLAKLAAPYAYEARVVSGLLLIGLAIDLALKLLSGGNAFIRHRSGEDGTNYTSYFDLLKVLAVVLGVILAAALTIDVDVLTLWSGLGILTAVLMLVFRETIHSILAGLKIVSWNLIREGDWIDVPSFNASGVVERIGLYDIKIKNWDLTTSLIPSHKILAVATNNYRDMRRYTRARRIHEKFFVDIESIRFCDRPLLERLSKIDSLSGAVSEKLEVLAKFEGRESDPACLDQVQSNVELFRHYIELYLRSRDDLHQKHNFTLVRVLGPTEQGFPLEFFAFTRQTDFADFAATQTSILTHLVSMVSLFDLRLYQK